MINHPLQLKAFESVPAALPFKMDHANIEIAHGPSYTISPVKAHDYGAGVMAAMSATVEHLGRLRGLPAQTLKLNRRRSRRRWSSATPR